MENLFVYFSFAFDQNDRKSRIIIIYYVLLYGLGMLTKLLTNILQNYYEGILGRSEV